MKVRVHNDVTEEGALVPGTGFIEETYLAVDLADGRMLIVTEQGIAIFPHGEDGELLAPEDVYQFKPVKTDASESRE